MSSNIHVTVDLHGDVIINFDDTPPEDNSDEILESDDEYVMESDLEQDDETEAKANM